MTPAISKSGSAISRRKDGTANAGVPQKTIRSATARLPVAGFSQFADFPLNQVPLEHAEMRDEENSIEVVDLVAECAGEQTLAAHFEFFPRGILRADGDILRPCHVSAKSGDRKATLFFSLLSFGMNDFRIRADDFRFDVLPVAHVNHGHPPADS